ncbi:MAG: hypothetical protein LBG08_04175 [Spirochaetaceae bacterium]|jgi:hypothetical protein|nr:hypothetical protein [Spirochaetaceae bacterium]
MREEQLKKKKKDAMGRQFKVEKRLVQSKNDPMVLKDKAVLIQYGNYLGVFYHNVPFLAAFFTFFFNTYLNFELLPAYPSRNASLKILTVGVGCLMLKI